MKRKRVEDLMSTAIVAVKETDPIGLAIVEMEVAAIRHLPVIDDKHRLVGLVSNRDLMQAVSAAHAASLQPLAHAAPPGPASIAVGGDPKRHTTVGDIMNRKLWVARPKMPAHEAARIMIEHKIGALPVVDGPGHLVGVLTETDLILVAERALRELWSQSHGEGHDRDAEV